MKRIFRSFSTIINYKTFIVTILSVVSTYVCYSLDLTAKFPDMLVGVAIVFPVVFFDQLKIKPDGATDFDSGYEFSALPIIE